MKRNALIAATLAALSAPPAGATGITLENVQITSYQLGAAAGDQPRLPAALGQAVGDKIGIPNEETRPMMPKAVPAERVGVYNQTTGAFFLKNTNTPGATHPNGVNLVLFDGSVRLVNPSRTAPPTGLSATPALQAPSLSPVGKPGAVAPGRR